MSQQLVPLLPSPTPRPTLLQRVFDVTGISKAVRRIVGSDITSGYFTPGAPPSPQGPASFRPRQEDYRTGYNINIPPRSDEPVGFWDLYMLAENDNITRLLIETRKDQIAALTWAIKSVEEDEDDEVTPDQLLRIKACKDFFKSPDGEHTFDEWVRLLLEDVLVYDAPCVYVNIDDPLRTRFQVVSGMTITRKVDINGRTPAPPDVAYQQIIHGTVGGEYSSEEMIYKPRNLRPNRVYGMSPVQQIIMTVNLALRKQQSQLYYFSEGTIPDALISVPPEWTPKQISDFQNWWDDMLTGNLQQRRHAKFVPGGSKIEMTKPAVLTDDADLWFTKIRCYAFSIPPTAFEARTNRATANTAKQAAAEEGLAPLMNWVKSFVDTCLQTHLGQFDLEFAWIQDDVLDPADQVAVLDTQLRTGALTLNEYREIMGRDSLGPDGDRPMIYTAQGAVLLADIINPPEPPPPPAGQAAPGNNGGKPPAGGGKGGNAGSGGQAGQKKPPAGSKAPPKDKAAGGPSLRLLKADGTRTLYISRPLINTDDLLAWAHDQGFAQTVGPDELHATLAFSKTPVDWDMAGAAPSSLRVSTGMRSVERLGDKGAIVLKFSSLQFTNRWRRLCDMGCSWDWPGYQPHITITYQGGDMDLSQVEPYYGLLEFGPEVFDEVKADWEKNIEEAAPEVGKAADAPFQHDRRAVIKAWSY